MMKRPSISDLERALMEVIWKRGKATAAEIQIELVNHRPLKDSTIRTVLLRLEDKGYVRHEVDGRTFVYSCLQAPGNLAARAVQQIVDKFCQGSLEILLAGMVNDELVDPDELRKMVDRLAHEKRSKRKRRK